MSEHNMRSDPRSRRCARFARRARDLRPAAWAVHTVLHEMWERFTFYGMRAILILFMVEPCLRRRAGDQRPHRKLHLRAVPGARLPDPLLGGYIADRLVGQQRAVLAGGILITIGNATLISGNAQVFRGLLINVFGIGLLKPNVSAVVAQLYPEGTRGADAGFSIFYMGINTGAFFGSWLVPLAAHAYGWHMGFGLPAIGMLLGGSAISVGHANTCAIAAPAWRRMRNQARGCRRAVGRSRARRGGIGSDRRRQIDPNAISIACSWLIGLLAFGYFAYLLFFAGLTPQERQRVYVLIALFIGCAIFFAGYEQMGASFNLFAQRYTERHVLGSEIPAGVLQAVNPFFIIVPSHP